MLKLFRNQGKALRWIMGIILFLVAGSMVITLVPNVFGPAGPANMEILAEVGEQPVTTADVAAELRQYQDQELPPEALAMMAESAVENLIAERVLFAEASALGLVPSEEDLARWLRDQLPDVLFPDGKFVGSRAYEGFVRQQFRRSVVEFEREILFNLAIESRLRRMVTDSVSVSQDEILQRFHNENDAVRIEWTAVDADGLRSEVRPEPEKLEEYFASNRLRYRFEERRPLKLMTVNPGSGETEYEVSDPEIELYYSQNQYRFEQPERVKVRHILFMTLDKGEDETRQALERAEEVLADLQGGADFPALAKEHSEDPGNADNGGDLGWISRGMMDPAFEDASFALQAGELSAEPVKSEFGYHLIRVDDRESGSIKPLSEVRDVIRDDLAAEMAQSDRYALMERALDAATGAGSALETAASQLGLPYQEFAPFSRSELPGSLPKAAGLIRAVFEEPVSEVFSVAQEEILYIGIVVEAVPARDAEFEEVRDTVVVDYVDTEAANLARARAEALVEDSDADQPDLRTAARRAGLQVTVTDPVRRDGELGELGPVDVLGEDAFGRTDGALQGPVAVGNHWVVFRTVEFLAADESALAGQQDTLRDAILAEKRNRVFDYFRLHKVEEYTSGGQVVRYVDRIQAYLRSMQRLI